jgi:hypothetical protein
MLAVKKALSIILIGYAVLMIISLPSQLQKAATVYRTDHAGLIGYVVGAVGIALGTLFFSTRWCLKLYGSTYKRNRQAALYIFRPFALLAAIFCFVFSAIRPFELTSVICLGISTFWGWAAFASHRWLKSTQRIQAIHNDPYGFKACQCRCPVGHPWCQACGKAVIL